MSAELALPLPESDEERIRDAQKQMCEDLGIDYEQFLADEAFLNE